MDSLRCEAFVRQKTNKDINEYWLIRFRLKVEGIPKVRWRFSSGVQVVRKKDGTLPNVPREVLLKMPQTEKEALDIVKKLSRRVNKKREKKTIPTDLKGYVKYYFNRKPTPNDLHNSRIPRINQFVRFVLEDKNYEMEEIDSGIAENYMRYLHNKIDSGEICGGTYNGYLRYARHLFNCAIQNNVCQINPFANFTQLENGQRLRVLSEQEESILLEHCEPWLADMVEDSLWLGLRINELVNMKFEYLDGNIINYPVRETKSGKKAITQGKKLPKERLIGVPQHILKRWNEQTLRDLNGYIYRDDRGQSPVKVRYLQNKFTVAWSRVFPKLASNKKDFPRDLLLIANKLNDQPKPEDLSEAKRQGKEPSLYHCNKIWREIKKVLRDDYQHHEKVRTFYEKLTFHHLRHTCATRDADSNASESMMMQKFGWSSSVMVERYVKASTEKASNMVALREKKIINNNKNMDKEYAV